MAISWLACGPQGVRRTVPTKTADAGAEDGGSGGGDTGGRPGTGGRGTGGSPGTGGDPGTGGSPGTGGATGGSPGTGGAPATGGSPGTGGMMPPPPDAAPDLAPDTAPVPETCTTGMAGAFMNTPMPSQTGTFTVRFKATPSNAATNGVVALSMGAAAGFADYAVAVRFFTTGAIDAINGGAYEAASAVMYTANATYQFRVTVDVTAHTYSVFVTPPGGAETPIGNNFGFRTQQAGVSRLDSWSVGMQAMATGTLKACGFAVE